MLNGNLELNIGAVPPDSIGKRLRMRIFNTLADLESSQSLWIGLEVKILGRFSIGDPGANEYTIVAGGTGTDDGGSFIDLPGSSLQAKALFPNPEINVVQFGATGDGSTSDTAALNSCFVYCRDNGRSWYIPSGTYRITSTITAYTSGKCDGTIIRTNNGYSGSAFDVAHLPADATSISASTINTWTGMHKGSSKIVGTENFRGQFIYVDTPDETLIGRYLASDLDQGDSFIVDSDVGNITPALYSTWTLGLTTVTAEAKVISNRIIIEGLRLVLDGTGATESGVGISCSRPNTTFVGATIVNESDAPVRVGFSAQKAAHITYEGCLVDGIDVNVTNYGFNSDLCCHISYIDCGVTKARRGVDATRSKNILIRGGNYPIGVGAHYSWNFTVEDAVLGTSNSANPYGVHFAGGDLIVQGCEINCNISAARAIDLRGDITELGGRCLIKNNKIIFDDTGDALGSADVYVADLRGNANSYDSQRKVFWPSLIEITGNDIIQKASSSDNVIQLLILGDDVNATTIPQDIEMSGRVIIDNNSFDLEGGVTTSGAAYRIRIETYKPENLVGNGYDFSIRKLPILETLIHSPSNRVDSNQRHRFFIEDVDNSPILSAAYGAYSTIQINRITPFTKPLPAGTGGYTPIGDEFIGNQADRSTFTGWSTATESAGVLTCPTSLNTFNPAAPVNITDLSAAFGTDTQEVFIRVLGANTATFVHNASKLRNISGGNIALSSNQCLHYIHISGSVWQQVGGKP